MSRPPVFIDCPPFLDELRRGELGHLVPDLEVHVGDPDPATRSKLLEGRTIVMNDHSQFDRTLMAACPDLKAIVFLGTGAASFVDLAAAADLGITVRNYKGYGDRSVAEHTIAMLFAAVRRIAEMDRAVRAGRFEPIDSFEIRGRKLGLIGTGGIGGEVARMAAGLGMQVLAWNRSGVDPALPAEAVELDDLLARADIVSLHLALNEETRGFLDAARIGRLKPGAILVNTARGAILDEAALIEALRAGRLRHAALDVFVEEPLPAGHALLALDNVTLTPHAGFMTREASVNLVRMALELVEEERAKL
ncbi:MAG: NAD(P)-dependent oxidoreductase [Geminicoccaceae bacterium]|jgi:D-3-phosphoglycerate dehydrogenase